MFNSRTARMGKPGVTRREVIVRSSRRHLAESLEGRTLFAAGDLDPTFGLGGMAAVPVAGFAYAEVTAVDVANGRTVVGGYAEPDTYGYGAPGQVVLAVFDQSGRPLKSFSGDGVETEALAVPGGVVDLVVQPDNKIVVLVGELRGSFLVARFNANGTLDAGFGQRAVNMPDASDVALAPNGDVIVGGSNGNIVLARFAANGTPKGVLDTGVRGSTGDLVVQADGKAVVSGNMPADGNGFDNQVVRVKADFSGLDTGFAGDGVMALPDVGYDDFANAVTLDPQGRILVGVVEAEARVSVYRVLGNGTLDATFAASTFETSAPSADDISVAPSGKVVVSGRHVSDFGYVARFNANGGADASFGGGDGVVTALPGNEHVAGRFHDVQPDGKVISVGAGAGRFEAFRLQADGAFAPGTVSLGADRVLRVTGTNAGNDDVRLDDGGGGYPGATFEVYLNGKAFTFRRDAVSRVEVSTLGGNDRVATDRSSEPAAGQLPRRINGGAGDDELHGGTGGDVLLGMEGNDRLFGNAGDDTVDGGLGTDLQDGGSGADTVDYSFRNAAVFVDLEGDADDGPAGERDTVAANVEHILGGAGADTLTGNGLANFIRGNGGNDTIRGGGGNDTLVGGAGQDKLYGEAGDDFLDARDGITDLVLDGGAGFDKAKKDAGDPQTSIEQLQA